MVKIWKKSIKFWKSLCRQKYLLGIPRGVPVGIPKEVFSRITVSILENTFKWISLGISGAIPGKFLK